MFMSLVDAMSSQIERTLSCQNQIRSGVGGEGFDLSLGEAKARALEKEAGFCFVGISDLDLASLWLWCPSLLA